MDFFNRNLGRRQFISLSSIALGTGMLMNPSRLLSAQIPEDQIPEEWLHEEEMPSMPPESGPLGSGPPAQEPRTLRPKGETKYGHYIFIPPEEFEDGERGTPIVQYSANATPGAKLISGAQMRMIPALAPYPPHSNMKMEDRQKIMCMIGNNPDDPMDLGAEANFFMGTGKHMERYICTRSVCVYNPTGQWHWPWQVTEVKTKMSWIHFEVVTRAEGGRVLPRTQLTKEALLKAEADPSKFIYNKYVLSGVGRERKDPKGGKWIIYLDSNIIAEAPMLRILQYRPEEAPYPVIGTQTHEYESFICLYGIGDDLHDLGAEVDLYIGPEKEKHTIKQSSMVYIPAHTKHGPFIVKKAKIPFLFVEIVGGPEQPGAIYDNEIIYEKYKKYL